MPTADGVWRLRVKSGYCERGGAAPQCCCQKGTRQAARDGRLHACNLARRDSGRQRIGCSKQQREPGRGNASPFAYACHFSLAACGPALKLNASGVRQRGGPASEDWIRRRAPLSANQRPRRGSAACHPFRPALLQPFAVTPNADPSARRVPPGQRRCSSAHLSSACPLPSARACAHSLTHRPPRRSPAPHFAAPPHRRHGYVTLNDAQRDLRTLTAPDPTFG